MIDRLRAYLELSKIRITALATVTTAAGYFLATESVTWEILLPVLGILFLACGSSALNQIQERRFDAKMDRTRNRPLPSGRVSLAGAVAFTLMMILAGSAFLYIKRDPVTLGLGLAALVWYNGVYTPLKRWTAFAVVPGAVIGALPPVVGWTAAGGNPTDPAILSFALFFFVWQIPHFWLILLYLGRDYEKAGLPSMHEVFSPRQLMRITFIWILATGLTSLSMPVFGLGKGLLIYFLLLASTGWLIWNAATLLRSEVGSASFRGVFRNINLYALLVIVTLTVDKLLPMG